MIELLQTPITITQTHLSPRIPALNRENNFCSGVEKGDQSRVIRECVSCVCVLPRASVFGLRVKTGKRERRPRSKRENGGGGQTINGKRGPGPALKCENGKRGRWRPCVCSSMHGACV